MEKTGVVELRDEIYTEDAYKIADWLENDEITKYLTEGKDISSELRKVLKYNTCPILTHLFCNGGNFYMISSNGRAIGYSKLIKKNTGCEVVIVIGDTSMWNKGYGTRALELVLKEAFFSWRYDKVIAKIMFQNSSSKHLFEKMGFNFVERGNSCNFLELPLKEYLKMAA